jgi:hypothetical protein
MPDQQLINNFTYSWSSVVITVADDFFSGIKSITYSDKREVAVGYGQGRNFAPVSRTSGQYSADDGKIVMRLDTWQALSLALAIAPNGSGSFTSFGNTEFQCTVQFIEPSLSAVNHVIERMRITGVSNTVEQKTDESSVELTYSAMSIRRDGLTLFDETVL